MGKSSKTAVAAIVLFALLVATELFAAAHPNQPGASPSIRLQSVDGQIYDIADQRGSVVLVSFGATWCTPCSAELHALEELKREYAGKPVKFFWVSIESRSDVSDSRLKRYSKDQKISFPVLRDPDKSTYMKFTQRVRLPLILFFGKRGELDASPQFGMRSPVDLYKADIRARLNKLLAET